MSLLINQFNISQDHNHIERRKGLTHVKPKNYIHVHYKIICEVIVINNDKWLKEYLNFKHVSMNVIKLFSLWSMMKLYKKVHTFSSVLAYFCTRSWRFHNDNVQELWSKLEPKDKELFPFSMKQMDWDMFFHNYVRGIRRYVLKEDPSNIPQARSRYMRYVLHYYRAQPCYQLLLYFTLILKLSRHLNYTFTNL